MFDTILFIGTGQIGKAILNKIFQFKPKTIIVHNLTKKESDVVCEKYKKKCKDIKFVSSYGNIFMPYSLRNVENKDLYSESESIINYFYSEITSDILENSSIVTLIKTHKPDLIVDAINTATVLGNSYDPENRKKQYINNIGDCCQKLLVDDYTTKLINFVYSLKYGIETYGVKKYVKVSTTGLGGMGINMPYTHGDNPKLQLSSALMGKISASGVLHQLLWNLSHTKDIDISLIIPATFVGYDSVKSEPIETDKGLIYKRESSDAKNLNFGQNLVYNPKITNDYLQFPVVRAGENHVYSNLELQVLTALGQMEAITKEEVANHVIESIKGCTNKDILSALDNTMLGPTYCGKDMINEIEYKFKNISKQELGIATGNLGVTLSKQLYELYLIKQSCETIEDLKNINIETLCKKVNNLLTKDLIAEIISLGIPILTNNDQYYIGDYSLFPSNKDDKMLTQDNLKKWVKVGWVDLREENLIKWRNRLLQIFEDAEHEINNHDYSIDKSILKIKNDYNIAEYLAYYYNLKNKGRKK